MISHEPALDEGLRKKNNPSDFNVKALDHNPVTASKWSSYFRFVKGLLRGVGLTALIQLLHTITP
jgi:hypothetical protein